MKQIEVSDETYEILVDRQQTMFVSKLAEEKRNVPIPTFDEVFKKLENDLAEVCDENAKLINQLLLAEVKPFYMDKKHFDETKPLRDKLRKKSLHSTKKES